MRAQRLAALLAFGLSVGGGLSRAQQAAAPASSLAAQDAQIQKIYQNIANSAVHVTVTQTAQAIVDSEGLHDKYEAWQKSGSPGPLARSGRSGRGGGAGGPAGGGGGGGGDGRGNGQTRPDGAAGGGGGGGFGRGNPSGPGGFGAGRGPGGSGGGFNSSQVVRFLQYQADQETTGGNADLAAHLRGQALRVQINPGGFQGVNMAMVIDRDGHALLLGGIFKEATADPAKPMPVAFPDGTQGAASYVGADLYAGYTIVKLSNLKGVVPASWSKGPLKFGQTLLPVAQGQSFVAELHVQAGFDEKFSEDRLLADEQVNPRFGRGGAFLFDVEGNLAAVVTSGTGLNAERFALSGTRMRREIDYILKQGKDIEPRSLGVSFVAPPTTATAPATGHRAGQQVSAITPGSLGAAAHLQVGDLLLSIDGRSMSDLVTPEGRALPALVQLQVDLMTRTGDVPLTIVRDGKEITLQMPLGSGN